MSRVLTGIQSSGNIHLGNIVGAIEPALKLGKASKNPAFYFIADLHSLTSSFNPRARIDNVVSIAAAWIAFGAGQGDDVFYRQSSIRSVGEMTWYLSCFTPYGLLSRAHSFKDKSEALSDVNAGLFTYPVLMAADILLYNATEIPVGKDQKQHIEMTRDIAGSFNHKYGDILTLPTPIIDEDTMTIPGVDGRKMSKSYDNYIDIFISDKKLRKRIMQIRTNSQGQHEPKNASECNVFSLYSVIASTDEIEQMKMDYEKGSIGYGEAKNLLFSAVIKKYGEQREKYSELLNNRDKIEQMLKQGEQKANSVAEETIEVMRSTLGFSSII